MSVFVHGTEHTEAWTTDGEKKTRRLVRPDAFGPDLHRVTAVVRKNARRTSEADQSDPWAEPA